MTPGKSTPKRPQEDVDDSVCDSLFRQLVDDSPSDGQIERLANQIIRRGRTLLDAKEIDTIPPTANQQSAIQQTATNSRRPKRVAAFRRRLFFVIEIAIAAVVIGCVAWVVIPDDELAVDQAPTPFSELIDEIGKRDTSIKKLGYEGVVRDYKMTPVKKRDGESNEAFIRRCATMPAPLSGISANVVFARDYALDIIHLRYGDISAPFPKYLEYFFDGKRTTELMGVEADHAQGTIFGDKLPKLSGPFGVFPRMDILALRPIHDHPISVTLVDSHRGKTSSFPDPGGRRPFDLQCEQGSETFTTTFQHMEPGTKGTSVEWYRIHWKRMNGQLLIYRIEELPVDGDDQAMPRTVTLLEDFRSCDGVLLPHKVRYLMFGNEFLIGREVELSAVTVNDAASIPSSLTIPPGTSVRNMITGERFRAKK